MDMGEKIKQLRISKGMTLEQLGDSVGVGKSTVRKWENGIIANMRRDKIAKIANALDVTPGYLMGWEDEDPKTELSPEATKIAKAYDLADEGTKNSVAKLLDVKRDSSAGADLSA